jgi:predicted nucleotidyltransferase
LLPREKLKAQAEEKARVFLEQAKPFQPRVLILFGSFARGNFTEASDIDLCLIADKMPEEELARRTLTDLPRPAKVTAIGFQPDEFLLYLRGLRFLAFDIVADGIVIYDDGLYGKIQETYREVIKRHGVTRLRNGWRISKP